MNYSQTEHLISVRKYDLAFLWMLYYAVPQVVTDRACRYVAESFIHVDMAPEPSVHLHVQRRLNVRVKAAALTLMLTTSNTVGVNISEYLAIQDDNDNRSDPISRLMLYIYLELLPTIVQTYNGELAAGKWGKDSCVHFLQDVAHALADKVDARIDDLKKIRIS